MSDQKQGLGFPIATTAGLALGAISAKDFFIKNWKWVAGIGLVGVTGWLVYDKFFADNVSKENVNIDYDPNFPPSQLSDLEAKVIADNLFAAMDAVMNTDEQAIYNNLDGLTINDFAKVSKAFGTKYYNKNLGTEGYAGWFNQNEKYDLYNWLRFELKPAEIRHLNSIIPSVFKNNLPITVGSDVAAKTNNVQAHNAVEQDGTWVKTPTVNETYNEGQKIGEVVAVLEDPWEATKFAVIDKSFWNGQKVIVPTEKLKII